MAATMRGGGGLHRTPGGFRGLPRKLRDLKAQLFEDAAQSRAALTKAERELARVQSETPRYEALGRDLAEIRERNHFADSIRATVQRETGSF